LVTGQRLGIDEGLHIKAVPYSGLGLIHCFYFHTKTQASTGRQGLIRSRRKGGENQAIRAGRQERSRQRRRESMLMSWPLHYYWTGRRRQPGNAGWPPMTLPRH
ncbi:MAG: hypothetical protein ACN6OP_21895, partial [Pseudomonadales bacterium]